MARTAQTVAARPSQPAANPRKRRQSSPSTSAAASAAAALAAQHSLGRLAFDDEGHEDPGADVLAESDDDEDDGEAFPELDVDASADDADADGDEDSFDGSVGSDDEEDELDDEEILRRELEAEQNEVLASSDDDDEDPSDLDELIRRNTSKPAEDEALPSAIPGQNRALGEGRGSDAFGGLPQDYMRRSRAVKSKVTGKDKTVWDEEIEPDYASDSSTEETTNRVGNIPSYWYDDMPHIGYDIDGKKVMRPATGDELDRFLEGVEDADGGWTTVQDKLHKQDVQLSQDELELIQRLAKAENPDSNYDPYADTIPYFTEQTMQMPLSARPEPKSRFLPSKWEHKKVMKIVRAIRAGRIVPRRPGAAPAPEKPRFYALWNADDTPVAPHPMHMPAPKLAPPTHAESYNPPEEYLWTKEEEEEHAQLEKDEQKGKVVPRKFDSLRRVPAYANFVQERFDRCLDLYLAPRMLRRRPKLDIKDPSELLPRLPSPQELRPFPTTRSVAYVHPGGVRVRCVSVDPTGMWVATGAEDGEVRLWEAAVGRCAMKWKVGGAGEPVYSLEWCPDREKSLFAAATANKIHLIAPLPLLSDAAAARTSAFALAGFNAAATDDDGNKIPRPAQPEGVAWFKPRGVGEREEGRLVEVEVPGHELKQVTWHKRGDYFATVASPAGARSVLIHQLSKHHTQAPFAKLKGDVQRIQFHPLKPHFYVATQRHVRVYDLMKQQLVKTLQPGLKWISSLDVHPLGDHVLVGSYDRRLVWHDLDLSTTPYKTLKYHQRALRSVAFHPTLPLFASSSDDGSVHVFHATVYNDLLTNPLIVPLKVLRGHDVTESLGVLDIKWHPREPWLVSVGADGVGRLWCN
ncbi:ribosome biogenesis protein ERB1 [Rhodotorula paludigena]|uniref:ribosome biogenesis protein ERB1 n=1 Tax=Rhodotorula paludigena TaxID=86838 RepID=UPI0031726164